MPRYACREDNGQLKLPPAGSDRRVFCAECPNGPCKGENCLFGHSAETRYLIKRITLEQRYAVVYGHAMRDGHFCALCGLPMRGRAQNLMHRECWAKVMTKECAYRRDGLQVERAAIIQELMDDGQVSYPI